jgi:transcriptional regulator with XRE-family HTH domain
VDEIDPINLQVGARLRDIRKLRGWSLLDVESASGGEFKASVLGAYERGERALSVPRLVRLSALLDVPPPALLPDAAEPSAAVIDLSAAESAEDGQGEVIDRFLVAIQAMRAAQSASSLTVRQSDLKILGALLDPAVAGDLTGRPRDDA